MTPTQLHDLLQHADWLSNFDERTAGRGFDYAHRHKVLTLRLSSGNDAPCVLEGVISGSQMYDCRVKIDDHDGWLTMDTDCSCPVGIDCKHAVAMLRTASERKVQDWPDAANTRIGPASTRQSAVDAGAVWLRQLGRSPYGAEPDPTQQWTHWLQQLDAAPTNPIKSVDAGRSFGVLLRGDDQDQLLVNPVWLRPGKTGRGALVDPHPLTLHWQNGPQPAPRDGWPPGVAGALALLLQDKYIKLAGQTWTHVNAAHQEQALDTVLAHYAAYFEKGSKPLQRGRTLPLELQWQPLPDGNQRLLIRVDEGEPPTLLRGAGLWYVLPGRLCFGRVDGDPRLLDAVAQAPAVAPEHVDALRQRLQSRRGTIVLPLPAETDPIETIDTTPVPVLQMRVVEFAVRRARGARRRVSFGCARLRFDYQGHLLPPFIEDIRGSTRGRQGRRIFDIHHDMDTESVFQERIEDGGLIEADFYAFEQGIRRHGLDEHDFLLQPDGSKPPLDAQGWRSTLNGLAADGFRIEYDDGFPHDQLLDIDDWHADIEPSGNSWFDVSLGIDVDGVRVDLLPVLRRLLLDPDFPRTAPKREKKNATYRVLLDANRSVEMPLKRLRALIEPLLEWLEGDGELRLHRSQAPALRELADAAQLIWKGGDALREHLELLASAKRSVPAPRGFKARLRPYQCEGLAWLDFLGNAGLGGILADDMGLGKTVQVLAHIVGARQRKQLREPVLVVAPTSLVGNWRDEAARFAPRLKVLIIHGADRADRYDDIASHHLVITTYPLLARDRDKLIEARFSLLVLDEAQAIKNASSQAAQVVREIPADRRLAMTGTPLENHLGELWAQFDAVEPGLLGSQRQFTKLYRTPIEKHGDAERQQRLNRRVGPLLLRRRKDQVLTELPAKNEVVRSLELAGDQRGLYETLRLAQHERVRDAVEKRGMAQAGIIVLDALLKLRQACCDPRLVKLPSAMRVKGSAKLEALLELIDGLLGEGRRILVFSQFTEMLGLIELSLHKRKIPYQILTGKTPGIHRAALVQRFQQGDVPLFLISLKAGGVGLNLTAADTVIHYDPWWNPAVEAQATDRVHRIGQDKPVFVYKLIARGTVEEKIQAMQARKAELARAVLDGGASQRLRFDEADLAELFAPM